MIFLDELPACLGDVYRSLTGFDFEHDNAPVLHGHCQTRDSAGFSRWHTNSLLHHTARRPHGNDQPPVSSGLQPYVVNDTREQSVSVQTSHSCVP